MLTTEATNLRNVLEEITPRLDSALSEGSIGDRQFMGPYHELPRDLKRRGGICHATSWLLKEALRREGVRSTPHSKMGEIFISGHNLMTYHVLLKTEDGKYADPTYQQFFNFVGLSPAATVCWPELTTLYPENDIAIVDPTNYDFQDCFAEQAHRIDLELTQGDAKFSNDRAFLMATTLDEKVNTYRQLWDLSTYKPMEQPPKEMCRAINESGPLLNRSPVE